jgi:hypothetical protein
VHVDADTKMAAASIWPALALKLRCVRRALGAAESCPPVLGLGYAFGNDRTVLRADTKVVVCGRFGAET